MTDLLPIALAHAARGWRVFPLRPGDKRPAIRDWESRAACDPHRIRQAWGSPRGVRYNIGIACGPSNLVVIDLDTPEHNAPRPTEWERPGIECGADVLAALADEAGEAVPLETFSVETPSRGEHVYFAAPAGAAIKNSAGKLGWLIDVRSAGGYIVAAGSVVGGRRYRGNGHPDVALLPDWITALLGEPDSRPTQHLGPFLEVAGRRSQYAAAALRGEVDRVLAAQPGSHQRNDTLNRAAFALGQLVATGLLTEGIAWAALVEASAMIGLPVREADRTIRSGLTAGARSPRRPTSEGRP